MILSPPYRFLFVPTLDCYTLQAILARRNGPCFFRFFLWYSRDRLFLHLRVSLLVGVAFIELSLGPPAGFPDKSCPFSFAVCFAHCRQVGYG